VHKSIKPIDFDFADFQLGLRITLLYVVQETNPKKRERRRALEKALSTV